MNPMNDVDPKQFNVACKYYMNGFCKNGTECSYYHPQPNEFMIYYNIMLREQLVSNLPVIPYCQVMPQPAYFVNHQPIPITTPTTNFNNHHHHHHHQHQQKYVPPNISMYSEVFEEGDEEVSFYQPKVCTFYLSGKGCKYGYHCKFFHPTIQSTNRGTTPEKSTEQTRSPSTSTSQVSSMNTTIPISKIKKSHHKKDSGSHSPTHSSRSSSSDSASNSSLDDKKEEFFQQTGPELVQENSSYASILRKSLGVVSQ